MPLRNTKTLRPMLRSARLLMGLIVVGTIGYKIIGGRDATTLDALYMTVITITTVGYREVIDLSASAGGRIFTTAYLMIGVSVFLYFFSNVTAFVIEGTLDRVFWKRRMQKRIGRLKNHYIVCGAGDTGEHVVRELVATERSFVLIEQNMERADRLQLRVGAEFPIICGDATEDDVLEAAGVRHATGLITCVSSDKDNLVVTFSARNLRHDLRIVCRSIDEASTGKMRRAGADAVVSPNQIGGLRMVSELVRPRAASFLDTMLRDKNNLRVEEVLVHRGSAFDGAEVGQLHEAREGTRLLIVAIRTTDQTWIFNPPADTVVRAGMALIFIGDPVTRAAAEIAAGDKELAK